MVYGSFVFISLSSENSLSVIKGRLFLLKVYWCSSFQGRMVSLTDQNHIEFRVCRRDIMKITMRIFDCNDNLITKSRKSESKSSSPTLTTGQTIERKFFEGCQYQYLTTFVENHFGMNPFRGQLIIQFSADVLDKLYCQLFHVLPS